VRLAVHIRAHIEQHAGRARHSGHARSQRRPIDSRQRAQHHLGRGHGRAGVAGGHKSRDLLLPHQLQPNAHRAVLFGADSVRSLLLHADPFRGMVDDDGQIFVFQILVQQIAQLRLGTDQMHTHRKSPASLNRAANLRLRSFVRAKSVERDIDQRYRKPGAWALEA
jgi:hypothetical protein